MNDIAIKEIDGKIQVLKQTAEDLKQMAPEFPALQKNVARILVNIKMLEINISDVADLYGNDI